MAYITVEEVRAEGVAITDYDDPTVTDRIALAQNIIEGRLRCFYEKRDAFTFTLNGTGHDLLWLPVPPISTSSITSVTVDDELILATDYRVIMPAFPDGRMNPKLYAIGGTWPKGIANITVFGSFGYVDAAAGTGGAIVYSAPPGIKRLCTLITIWGLPKLADAEARKSGRIIQESFADYSYQLAQGGEGMFNDPEISGLFRMFTCPAMVTA